MKAQLRRDLRQIMWKQALLKESATWQKDADLLLANSKIIGFLGEYGRVVLAGSYRLSLMMSGDIDIKVINSKLEKSSVVEALNRLIDKTSLTTTSTEIGQAGSAPLKVGTGLRATTLA